LRLKNETETQEQDLEDLRLKRKQERNSKELAMEEETAVAQREAERKSHDELLRTAQENHTQQLRQLQAGGF
jgi:hypothetical protein